MFTCDLNLTIPRGRTRETFCQLWSKMYVLVKKHTSSCSFKIMQCIRGTSPRTWWCASECTYWEFSILLVFATDMPKRSGIQKKNNALAGIWRTFDKLWLLNEYCTISFLSYILNTWVTALFGTSYTKNLKNLTSSVTSRESPIFKIILLLIERSIIFWS